jgi:hypothetical protein
MGPRSKSTVLTPAEAVIVEFQRRTLLPLDNVLGCLNDTIPNLGRSALHRCLQRHGISRLPVGGTKEKQKQFKTYDIGHVHIVSVRSGRVTLIQPVRDLGRNRAVTDRDPLSE